MMFIVQGLETRRVGYIAAMVQEKIVTTLFVEMARGFA
jgi:hypothetical protein